MKSNKVISELICSPVGVGVGVSSYVSSAVKKINEFEGVKVITHPMGTVYETESIDLAFEIAKAAHNAIIEAGASRVVTQLRIDDRRDKGRDMEDKVKAVS